MRLDKFLSHHLGLSRNHVSKLIKKGEITVDNAVIKNSAFHLHADHNVYYENKKIEQQVGYRYFMLNKPVGYVCSTNDPRHPTVLYFIDEPMPEKLHSAGRLDIDTTGLVLLTDDGKWSHCITSPHYHCDKTYFVTVDLPLKEKLIVQFEQGITLKSEEKITQPATLIITDTHHAAITLSEGRYHQVKRMFAAMGYHVLALHRNNIGAIELDINEGEYRSLTEEEIQSVSLIKGQ